MTRLIDADDVEKVLTDLYIKRPLDSDRWVIAEIKKGIMDLPTIDAVQVIRCKDCKYRITANCERFGIKRYTQSDNFCSWAEPKENNE